MIKDTLSLVLSRGAVLESLWRLLVKAVWDLVTARRMVSWMARSILITPLVDSRLPSHLAQPT